MLQMTFPAGRVGGIRLAVPGRGGCREDRFEVLPLVLNGDLEP
jgi:hypothetical protein